MTLVERLMDLPVAYLLCQAPFARAKLEPVRAHNDIGAAQRVLDVGCGPGTNAHRFRGADYVGLDINPRYVAHARRHQPGRFILADATKFRPTAGSGYDFVLVNSLLHHLPDERVQTLLDNLGNVVHPDGFIHVLDLVLPQRASIARLLARWDRGGHARPLSEWRRLLERRFRPAVWEPYALGISGLTLWNMVYFKGCPR